MATISQALNQAMELRRSIRALFRLSTYNEYCDLGGLDIDYTDSEQLFQLDELRYIIEKLADVEDVLHYLGLPIQEVSQLQKNSSGQYEPSSGQVFHCGNRIEALGSDDYHAVPYWSRTRVEHNGTDYYLVGHRGVSLDGLTIRTRKEV